MSLKLILSERQRRAAIVADAGKILTAAATEGRSLKPEEREKWQKMHDDAEEIRASVERLEAQHRAEQQVQLVDPTPGAPEVARAADHEVAGAAREAQRQRVLRSYLLGRKACENLSSEDQAAARRMGIDLSGTELTLRGFMPRHPSRMNEARNLRERALAGTLTREEHARFRTEEEQRANMTTATDPAAIPTGFVAEVEVAMLAFGGMREAVTVLRTASGNPLPFPTVDDTANTGELVTQGTAVAEKEVHVASLQFDAWTYSSKMVPLSLELLQDQAVNVEALIGRLAGTRIARILNTHLTTGDGASKPKGVVVAATASGITSASPTAVTWPELLQLKHSVDPSYRTNASWMFKDSTLLAIKSLVDTTGRPLWAAGIGVGAPDTLDGDRYVVNQDMAGLVALAKPVLYGDFSKYLLRDVLDIQLVVLRERYAEQRLVGIFAFSRHDGDLLDAGTHPIKYLAMHA